MATILLLALYVINLGYGFEESGKRLRSFVFVSRLFAGQDHRYGNRFADGWLGALPVPLPKNYVEGIDLQRVDFENGKPSYLRGVWRNSGWWYWYLYALAVKVPLGTWGLLLLAVGVRLSALCKRTAGAEGTGHRAQGTAGSRTTSATQAATAHGSRTTSATRSPQPPAGLSLPAGSLTTSATAHGSRTTSATVLDEIALLAPLVAVLVLVSSQTGFSRYLRYALPILPYAFIWASSVVRACGPLARIRQKVVTAAVLAALGWSAGSSLWYYPHSLSYFNELAGGPRGGPAHLLDAQVDWGQDLLFLKQWLDAHPEARPLRLAYFGSIDPRLAGIEFSLPPRGDAAGSLTTSATGAGSRTTSATASPAELQPGWYAVSVNFVYGYPFRVPDGQGGLQYLSGPDFNYFRRFEPVATAGYSIYIYRVGSEE